MTDRERVADRTKVIGAACWLLVSGARCTFAITSKGDADRLNLTKVNDSAGAARPDNNYQAHISITDKQDTIEMSVLAANGRLRDIYDACSPDLLLTIRLAIAEYVRESFARSA